MIRIIDCYKCGTELGEIRDALLRKDISYICGKCRHESVPTQDYHDMPDFMKDIFGGTNARY